MNRRPSVLVIAVILLLAVSGVLAGSPNESASRPAGIGADTGATSQSWMPQQQATSRAATETASTTTDSVFSDDYQLVYSTSSDRADPQPLDAVAINGSVYVFVLPTDGIARVDFALDGKSQRRETRIPWDLAGGSSARAKPWDTTTVVSDAHQIDATLQLTDGSTRTLGATVVVDNGDVQPPTSMPEPTENSDPDTTPTATPAPEPGTLTLTSTFNTIGVALRLANSGPAIVRYRASGGEWNDAFPLWYAGDTYYGSILFRDPGTTFEVEVTVGANTYSDSVTTRAEDIPAASDLTPTHYVCATCEYTTVQQAWDNAPVDAIVQVAPGQYDPPSSTRSTPLTLVAEYPAVDDAGNEINAGQRSVIAAPMATYPDTTAEWEQVTLTGPATGEDYTVWRWKTGLEAETTYLTIDGNRVAHWDRKGDDVLGFTLRTPEGWTEVLYRNDAFNYGYRMFAGQDDEQYMGDIYARFPDDLNPNDHTIRLGDEWMTFAASNVRVSGFELVQVTISITPEAHLGVVDHNLFREGVVWFTADRPGQYPSDHVIEYNVMRGSGVWMTDPAKGAHNGWIAPWSVIKGALYIDGQKMAGWARVLAGLEIHAIHGKGGGNRLVIRYNTISGYFNGIGGYNSGYDRNSWRDVDIHDNEFFDIGDDVIEPERQTINWRVWNNDIHDVLSVVSAGPLNYGPLFVVRNNVTDIGNHGSPADRRGIQHNGKVFKYSGKSNPQAMVIVVGNTFTTAEDGGLTNGGLQAAGGGPNQEFFYLRNNIFSMTRYAFDYAQDAWDEDYNHWATSDGSRCLGDHEKMSTYRQRTRWGDQSNPAGECHAPLAVGDARFIDAGVVVPNLDETYRGNAPDIGYLERGNGRDNASSPAARR